MFCLESETTSYLIFSTSVLLLLLSLTSVMSDSVTLLTVACRSPLSMGFSRQENCVLLSAHKSARIVFLKHTSDHATSLVKNLYWLPFPCIILLKVFTDREGFKGYSLCLLHWTQFRSSFQILYLISLGQSSYFCSYKFLPSLGFHTYNFFLFVFQTLTQPSPFFNWYYLNMTQYEKPLEINTSPISIPRVSTTVSPHFFLFRVSYLYIPCLLIYYFI